MVACAPLGAQTQHTGSRPGFGRFTRIIPGIEYQSVQRLTGSVDFFFQKWNGAEGDGGNQLGVDIGQGGGKIRLGRGGASPIGSFSGFIAVLHTWNRPLLVNSGQTFLGPELRWDLAVVALGIGYYFRVAGSTPGDGHVLNLTIGLVYPFSVN